MTNPNISAALERFDKEFEDNSHDTVIDVLYHARFRLFLQQELLTLAEKERQVGRDEAVDYIRTEYEKYQPSPAGERIFEEARHPKTI